MRPRSSFRGEAGQRPKVWLVDDRPQNREDFKTRHEDHFDVTVYSTPEEVLEALRSGESPDALLCDIYFYDDAGEREEAERKVADRARELRALATELGGERPQRGIRLIEEIRKRQGRRIRFPIYAYTSKGAYLFQNEAFDKLEELQARWLFKRKYSPERERNLIANDIEEFRERYDARRRIWRAALRAGLVTAVLGALLGVLLGRALTKLSAGWVAAMAVVPAALVLWWFLEARAARE